MSYRNSHLAKDKGKTYHALFENEPYRRMIWGFEKQILDSIIKQYLPGGSFSHLDFACGTGRILQHIGQFTHRSTGVDVSPSMLEVARQNNSSAEIIQADLTQQNPLAERTFDLITAFRFFPNAEDALRQDAIYAIRRHLPVGGYFVFNNHKNTGSVRNRLARVAGRKNFLGMSSVETENLVKSANLNIVKVYHLSTFPASEKNRMLPVGLLRQIERITQKLPFCGSLSENLIYLCKAT